MSDAGRPASSQLFEIFLPLPLLSMTMKLSQVNSTVPNSPSQQQQLELDSRRVSWFSRTAAGSMHPSLLPTEKRKAKETMKAQWAEREWEVYPMGQRMELVSVQGCDTR